MDDLKNYQWSNDTSEFTRLIDAGQNLIYCDKDEDDNMGRQREWLGVVTLVKANGTDVALFMGTNKSPIGITRAASGMFWLDGKFFLVPNKEVDNG
jgi:hypothetical protein